MAVMEVESGDLAPQAGDLLRSGHRLALVAAHHDASDHPGGEAIRVVYLFTAGPPPQKVELHLRTDAMRPRVPSLAGLSFPASRFEREMRDLYGVEPDGHPAPRPLVHHPHWPATWRPMRRDAGTRPALAASKPFPFLSVAGDGVYEIPVGPVHAGLIEPGHFRFSAVGETILRLKARLWYVHKGLERLFEGRRVHEAMPLAERVSGDTAVGHALAYTLAAEDALQLSVDETTQQVRAVLLELERLHNHIADIGALCNDVAYGIAHAHAQRIRERLLRLNGRITGHRLLRGGVYPGGARLAEVPAPAEIAAAVSDIEEIAAIALRHSVVRERFAGTAVLGLAQASDLGTLGYVARASGLRTDARAAQPFCPRLPGLAVPVQTQGDVLARFVQRVEEIRVSAAILAELLPQLRPGEYGATARVTPGGYRAGVGLVEGWRGTIAHRVEVGPSGRLTRVKIVDPSFFNWPALPIALADTIVPDFPLANKSFNLSYAGNDL